MHDHLLGMLHTVAGTGLAAVGQPYHRQAWHAVFEPSSDETLVATIERVATVLCVTQDDDVLACGGEGWSVPKA